MMDEKCWLAVSDQIFAKVTFVDPLFCCSVCVSWRGIDNVVCSLYMVKVSINKREINNNKEHAVNECPACSE